MGPLAILALLGGGYLLLRQPGALASLTGGSGISAAGAAGVSVGSVGFATLGPNSDSRYWYDGIKPGTVTVAGQSGGAAWQPGGNPMKTIAALTSSTLAIGGALGVGSVAGFGSTIVGSAAAPGFLAAGSMAASAIPFIGIGVAVVATIMGIISAHHQAALAAEGKALNTADPRMLNAMVMVLQALLAGEITTAAQAQQSLDQIVADWYGEVKNVERGTWHYTGQDMTADYQKVWIKHTQPPKGAPGYSDYHAPDPCNGACVVGHFFVERNRFLVLAAVTDALAGNHGQLVLPEIPPHDTQSGFPEILVTY